MIRLCLIHRRSIVQVTVLVLLLNSVLALALSFVGGQPVVGQQLPLQNLLRNQAASIDYVRRGDIDIAQIHLDGLPLFQVAAPAGQITDETNVLPIEWRVITIESKLADIVKLDLDPDDLTVSVNVLNNQPVIFVSDGETDPQPILTLTDLDMRVEENVSSEAELAQSKAQILERALKTSIQQRKPDYLWNQFILGLLSLGTTLFVSVSLFALSKLWNIWWRRVKQKNETELEHRSPNIDVSRLDDLEENLNLEKRFPTARFLRQTKLNQLFRLSVALAQIGIWFSCVVAILYRFPQTRSTALWLLSIPLIMLVIITSVILGKAAIDFLVSVAIQRWVNANATAPNLNSRIRIRAHTLSHVLQNLTLSLAIFLALFISFYVINALNLLLIGTAIVALTSQNLIKDWIKGALTIIEDSYALGDWIQIGSHLGAVEEIGLRSTKIRTENNELIIIDNSNITEVINYSNQRSGISIVVEVAYSSDLDKALKVMQETAATLFDDLKWKNRLIESPKVMGVDAFGDKGLTLSILFQTKPAMQWNVAREYRRRLKYAFDRYGILISSSQRWICFGNPLQLTRHE